MTLLEFDNIEFHRNLFILDESGNKFPIAGVRFDQRTVAVWKPFNSGECLCWYDCRNVDVVTKRGIFAHQSEAKEKPKP